MAEQLQPTPATDIPPGPHSSRVAPIQKLIQQWTPLPPSTKSPEEEFQEKYKEAQARFHTATALTRDHSDDPASYTAKVDDVVSCGIRLNELVAEHRAHKDDKERKYQQLFLGQQIALIFRLLDTFGPERGKVVCQQWEQAQRLSQAQQKRPASPPRGTPSNPAKRCRPNIPLPPKSLTGERSIHFNDVYQDGNAVTKYIITSHKHCWYILECKEHKLHFKTINPIKGARKHLTSGAHGHLQPNYDHTISMLGTLVTGCTKELADLNNDVTQRPSYEDVGRPSSVLSTESTRSSREYPRIRSTQVIPGLDPKPGEIYTAFWPLTKEFYAILVLPWGSFRQFGWEMTLKSCSGILDRDRDIPSCYKYNRVTESVEWAENFKPGGRLHHKRKYPVLYFDATDVPGKCLVGWVGVNEFRYYDPLDTEIPFKDQVNDFIRRMEEHNLSEDVEMGAQAIGPSSGSAWDQHQNTGADQPHLGASMRTAIYISDGDESDDDEVDTEARPPSPVQQQPSEPRVKTEPVNEEAPPQLSDAAAAQVTTDSVDSANQWNGVDRSLTVPNSGSRVDTNNIHNTVPNTPAVEDSVISPSCAPIRPVAQMCNDLPAPRGTGPPPREHQNAPVEDTGPHAPEAVMAPGDPPANGHAPSARMNDHAAPEICDPLDLCRYLSSGLPANTIADALGNEGLVWMTQRTVAEEHGIHIYDSPRRRSP